MLIPKGQEGDFKKLKASPLTFDFCTSKGCAKKAGAVTALIQAMSALMGQNVLGSRCQMLCADSFFLF